MTPEQRIRLMTAEDLQNRQAGLFDSLELVRQSGEARIWPLTRDSLSPGGYIQITGFVAARIVRVEAGSQVRAWVQPAALSTSTAITLRDVGFDQRRTLGMIVPNPYIAKVRLFQ